jgi:hypothetical protein
MRGINVAVVGSGSKRCGIGISPPTLALQLLAGYPLLNLNGMLSSNFLVQYSTNLAGTNWIKLLSLTNLPTSPYLLVDPAGGSERVRFYRAFMQ